MNIDNKLHRVMAIDYGLRRVGIALSDPLKKFAYPYKTLQNDKNLISNIIKIVIEMDVNVILIGIPDIDVGESNSISSKISDFKKKLSEQIKTEIIFWDENFSSKIAQQKILESVTKKKTRRNKALLDMHSAAVILSEYLEQLTEYK